jgi:SpoIID/LytB domain protein
MISHRIAPEITVGIISAPVITFSLNGKFNDSSGKVFAAEELNARVLNGMIILSGHRGEAPVENGYTFFPAEEDKSSFTLHAVVIGVNFHWQRAEDQSFRGSLKLLIENENVTAVNIISLEQYLVSVISSEMKATSSVELLRAHAVVSRSWLIAQMEKSRGLTSGDRKYVTSYVTDDEIVRWHDREEHLNYDVCADDHCQRYQGITRASTPAVLKVIEDTFGEVLMSEGSVCDSRYYKCCGGITELFENAWEPLSHTYIKKVIDNHEVPAGFDINLAEEGASIKWIKGNPPAFCNTADRNILNQVLNDYDQETNDFYRWKVIYNQEEISDLVRNRTGIDFGIITDLVPAARGTSGRITRLRITGTKKSMYIGKELEIRKALSKSHLYSSCFYVEKEIGETGISFILHGAGWGHGVGLCQIGAAVMGSKGYNYRQIVMHYFPGASLERIY